VNGKEERTMRNWSVGKWIICIAVAFLAAAIAVHCARILLK
jgi:hypothetical protein